MNPNKFHSLSRFFVLAASLFALATTASASVRIGGASLRANGQLARGFQYAGSCPVALKFSWGVISSEPTTIQYTFVRSDGGRLNGTRTADLPGGNRSVPIYDDWQLGADTQEFQSFHGWVELQIESPNPVSQRIAFTIHCGAPAAASVRIGGASLRANGQLAQGFQYSGSCPVALRFGWGVIGSEPTTITYTFVRSDGGRLNGTRTVDLPGGNRSLPIYDDWQLGTNSPQFQNYTGWVELQIESPVQLMQKITFTLHCG
jgi:cytochrome b